MSQQNPTILALDFDGVICDGLIEYFQTAWRTYCQIWLPPSLTPPDNLAANFYRLRPVVEIGWEMPILLKALIIGIAEEKIWQDWPSVAQQIIIEDNLNAVDIGNNVDRVRDEWINHKLSDWLAQHRFYPGVVEKIKSLLDSQVQPMIVTTKEGRFVRELLQQQNIDLGDRYIIGKECRRPKHQILRELMASNPSASIWFVEDRSKTLKSVQQQPDLNDVRLYLADWGYNTQPIRDSIRDDRRIKLLSLSQFSQDFSQWF